MKNIISMKNMMLSLVSLAGVNDEGKLQVNFKCLGQLTIHSKQILDNNIK